MSNGNLVEKIMAVDQRRRTIPRPLSMAELKTEFEGEIEALGTGFSNLDKAGAIYCGQCCIFTAESGMGKSLFTLNLALKLASNGYRTLYIDLENGGYELKNRLEKIGIASSNFSLIPSQTAEAFLDGNSALEVAKNITRYLDALVKYDFIVIDPLEIFDLVTAKEKKATDYQSLSYAVNHLKQYAQNKNISIFVCHHLNKGEQENKRTGNPFDGDSVKPTYRIPTLASVGGGGGIVNRATDVWAMIRRKHGATGAEQSQTLIRALKSRGGRLPQDCKFFLNNSNLTLEEYIASEKTLVEQLSTQEIKNVFK